MVAFGNALNAGADQKRLQQLSLNVTYACRNELAESWENPVGGTTNKSPNELVHQIPRRSALFGMSPEDQALASENLSAGPGVSEL